MWESGNTVNGYPFSALGRAVWDETPEMQIEYYLHFELSVLSVEPYGMKPDFHHAPPAAISAFSALGRAVWDETSGSPRFGWRLTGFQCSRSSRMG